VCEGMCVSGLVDSAEEHVSEPSYSNRNSPVYFLCSSIASFVPKFVPHALKQFLGRTLRNDYFEVLRGGHNLKTTLAEYLVVITFEIIRLSSFKGVRGTNKKGLQSMQALKDGASRRNRTTDTRIFNPIYMVGVGCRALLLVAISPVNTGSSCFSVYTRCSFKGKSGGSRHGF